MPVPNSIADLDPNPINNSPPGTESAKGNIDNYLRAAFAFIRQVYDSVATLSATVGTNDGTAVHKTGDEVITGIKRFNGTVEIGPSGVLQFEGATDDAFELLVSPGNPTADRTATFPDKSGTVAMLDDVQVSGQCELTKSGTNLVLSRVNGKYIVINGVTQIIPSAGVSLAPTGLTVSTLQYIYVYMNSGVMTLEASATAFAVDANTGVKIKTGDATRTLVGLAYIIAGPNFVDTDEQRYVRSLFNDKGISGKNVLSTNTTTSVTSLVEFNSGMRAQFIAWAGESVSVSANASHSLNNVGTTTVAIGVDSATVPETGSVCSISFPQPNYYSSLSPTIPKSGLTAGLHYATLFAQSPGGLTSTYLGIGSTFGQTSIEYTCH